MKRISIVFLSIYKFSRFLNSFYDMGFGENVSLARKKMGISQEELAKKVGTIAVTIGRYERNEIKPSVDVAARVADALGVSLDFLVGGSDAVVEKSLVRKMADIQKLPDDERACVHKLLDAFLRDSVTKRAYAQ